MQLRASDRLRDEHLRKTPLYALWPFLKVAVTSLCLGSGIGAVTAFFMTTGVAREYQMSMAETGTVLGAALGLVLGSLAYYAIFRGRMDFSTLSTVVTVTTLSSVSSAFLLHLVTDTGGWIGLQVGVVSFFVICLKSRTLVGNRTA